MNNFEKFRANEKVLETIRPGFLANIIPSWFWIFLVGGIIAASGILLYILPWPLFAKASIGISIAVVLFFLAKSLMEKYSRALILTNRRLIESKYTGFFHMSRTEWHYDQIYRVRFTVKGLLEKLTNAGYLKIEPIGGNASTIIGPISQPGRIQNLILELQREYIKHTRMGYFNPLLQENRQEDLRVSASEPDSTLSYGELVGFVRKIMEAKDSSLRVSSSKTEEEDDVGAKKDKRNIHRFVFKNGSLKQVG